MARKLPDKYTDPEEYADEQARRMLTARLRDEAYGRRWRRVWNAERARPIGQRRYFSFAEIAEQLARDPHSLATDPKLRERIARDLAAWVQNRQFASGEVITLSGDRPDFRPFQLTPGAYLVSDAELLFLGREACRRYVEARAELPGAAGLLRDWFGATKPTARPSAAKPQQAPFRAWFERKYPGGITRDVTVKDLAEKYLDDTRLIISPSTVRRALGRKQ